MDTAFSSWCVGHLSTAWGSRVVLRCNQEYGRIDSLTAAPGAGARLGESPPLLEPEPALRAFGGLDQELLPRPAQRFLQVLEMGGDVLFPNVYKGRQLASRHRPFLEAVQDRLPQRLILFPGLGFGSFDHGCSRKLYSLP